jgi:type IV secretion system protein VirD4
VNTSVRLGYRVPTKDGDPLRYKNDGHLLTVAPTGSGKGRDVLVPALLDYQGSCIVIDPKGQLAAITRKQRERMGQRVVVLNPFNILPDQLGPSARFNPMAALDPSLDSFGTDCDNIADALVVQDGGRESHWNESAHGLLAALIGHLVANKADDRMKSLAMVRTIVRKPLLLQQQAEAAQDGNDEMIAEALDAFSDPDPPNKQELAGIVSTARTQTRFLGTKAISDSLEGSDFRFRELKQRPTTVYLTLPTRYLSTCAKWFRLVVAAALDDLLREETGVPVLVILDEFYQLGRLKVIQNAMSLARGYGIQLWPILQDLPQLQEHYEKSWETFLGNAGVRMFFAPREMTTAEYVSQLCGETTVMTVSESKGKTKAGIVGDSSKSEGTSTGPVQRRLFLPQEVCGLPDDQFLLFADKGSKAVIRGYRRPFWNIPEFKNPRLYSDDPYHKGTTGSGASS